MEYCGVWGGVFSVLFQIQVLVSVGGVNFWVSKAY